MQNCIELTELLAFLRRHPLAVEATVSKNGQVQAAVVGIAVSEQLEIVFDTLQTTRKLANLRQDRRIALVVGWVDEQTAQLEGIADEPDGSELERLKAVYYKAHPDGIERQQWQGITYVRVRPHWIRYSDFRSGERFSEWSDSGRGLRPIE